MPPLEDDLEDEDDENDDDDDVLATNVGMA